MSSPSTVFYERQPADARVMGSGQEVAKCSRYEVSNSQNSQYCPSRMYHSNHLRSSSRQFHHATTCGEIPKPSSRHSTVPLVRSASFTIVCMGFACISSSNDSHSFHKLSLTRAVCPFEPTVHAVPLLDNRFALEGFRPPLESSLQSPRLY
jgi:hypothetical protein